MRTCVRFFFLCAYKDVSLRPSVNETEEVNASPIIYCGSGHPGSKVSEEGRRPEGHGGKIDRGSNKVIPIERGIAKRCE